MIESIIIAAALVAFLTVFKVIEMRANNKRTRAGKAPLTNDPPIVNVIDWTRRN